MAKGVKKIQYAGGKIYQSKSVPDKSLLVPANEYISFKVKEWEPETKEEDKKKPLIWLWQTTDKPKIVLGQLSISHSNLFRFKIPKKLCGPYTYYIEASLSGKKAIKETGIYVTGYSPPLVIKSKWCSSNDGEDVRKSKKFSYGENIYLNLETEGLNGLRGLVVEVYNKVTLKGDKKIFTYSNVIVTDGEVNLLLSNTSLWQGLVDNIKEEEEFYIKIKDSTGKYITDSNKDDSHARFLRIKNQLVANQPKKPTNLTPLKVGQSEAKKERNEPCKFETISITETQKKDGKTEQTKTVIFENGKNLVGVKAPQELINRTIFFDFDQATLTSKGTEALDNILNFLFGHQYSTMTLDGYACVIGKEKYNKELSLKRSEAVKKYLIDGGLDPKRMHCNAKGEIQLNDGKISGGTNDDKKDKDRLHYKDEKNYVEARRVDISFVFFGHDAKTIVYESIAPSHDKNILIDVTDFEAKQCFREKVKHQKQIKVTSPEYKEKDGKTKSGTSMQVPVHSALSTWNVAPLQYIWPKYNLGKFADSSVLYDLHVHSCRYYSNDKNATLLIKAYPDIKWDLKFSLNLTNDLSVKWKDQPEHKIKELQQKAGKVGAERRWKQKDASFGFSLKGDWDINDSGQYNRSKEFKAEYEAKFKKLYDLFSSVGAMSDGITSKTKGQIRNVGFKGIPMTFVVKPPNLNINGVWFLERAKIKGSAIEKVGTKVDISFNADPLIGLEITIDLLCTAVGVVAGAVSGGTASQPAMQLYQVLKGKINTGVEAGNDDFGVKASSDVFIDLIISSTIKTALGFSFNTESDSEDSQAKLESKCTLKVELKAGIWVKAEANLVVVKVEGYFEMSGKGSASITFGHGVKYDSKGLMYRPELGFDGLNVEYVIKGKVGLSSKKKVLGTKFESSDEGVISQGSYNEIVPKFDVIKSLEELFSISADIPLIKN